MMNYVLGGGQVVVGVGLLVVWWLMLTFLGSRWRDTTLSASRFAVVPCIFLIWLVAAVVLVLRGLGVV